jgi:hypothetical protein
MVVPPQVLGDSRVPPFAVGGSAQDFIEIVECADLVPPVFAVVLDRPVHGRAVHADVQHGQKDIGHEVVLGEAAARPGYGLARLYETPQLGLRDRPNRSSRHFWHLLA